MSTLRNELLEAVQGAQLALPGTDLQPLVDNLTSIVERRLRDAAPSYAWTPARTSGALEVTDVVELHDLLNNIGKRIGRDPRLAGMIQQDFTSVLEQIKRVAEERALEYVRSMPRAMPG